MRSYTTTQARKYLAEIMDIVMAGEPVIITRRGGSAAVLISREKFDIWQEIKQGANFSGDTEKHNQKLLMKT
ncbi:antitoxin Phd [Pantoea agglomerans]|jgi:antitoxin Phd